MNTKNRHTSLFQVIENLQEKVNWGSLLDAGTGVKSATWIAGLTTDLWTAVSADKAHLEDVRRKIGSKMRKRDALLLGNWADPHFLEGQQFDHVIADYLIGAMEGYAPYRQEGLMRRLRPLVKQRIYITGVDPYLFGDTQTDAGRYVKELARFRDSCALLAGIRPYREFPAEWVIDRLQQAAFQPVYADRFPSFYDRDWLRSQLRDCASLCGQVADKSLAAALQTRAECLADEGEKICRRDGGLKWGTEYVIAAVPV